MTELLKSLENSKILDSNDLSLLRQVSVLPDETSVNEYKLLILADIFMKFEGQAEKLEEALHKIAKQKLSESNIEEAWKAILAFND